MHLGERSGGLAGRGGGDAESILDLLLSEVEESDKCGPLADSRPRRACIPTPCICHKLLLQSHRVGGCPVLTTAVKLGRLYPALP